MRKVWYLIYVLLQCTWGMVQTGIGFFLFLKYRACPHRFFYGAVHTGWKREDGVSLGLFIFSPECKAGVQRDSGVCLKNAFWGKCRISAETGEGLPGRPTWESVIEEVGSMAVHEYGHTFQSLMLGPLYLIVIGVPSAIWANCRRYIKLREDYGVPYSFLFTEMWADYLGERMAKRFCSR